jgi:hypothetical protein
MGRTTKPRRGRRRNNTRRNWLLGGVIGGALLLIAAVALALRQQDEPGQTTFDPDFEPEVSGAPRVEVLPDEAIDYGDVKLNTTITTEYRVRNVGDEPLVIDGEPRVELVEGC